jgi:hypothetical protein
MACLGHCAPYSEKGIAAPALLRQSMQLLKLRHCRYNRRRRLIAVAQRAP